MSSIRRMIDPVERRNLLDLAPAFQAQVNGQGRAAIWTSVTAGRSEVGTR